MGERLADVGRDRRPGLPIITKAGNYWAGARPWHSEGGAERMRADAQRSIEILGDSVDLLMLHRADRFDDPEQSVATLAALRDEGLMRPIGLSSASVELIDRALVVAPIDAVQNRLGLGADFFDEYRHCREAGIDFFGYAPFGGPRAATFAALPDYRPVIGSTRVESVRDAVAAMSEPIDDELRDALLGDLDSRGVAV